MTGVSKILHTQNHKKNTIIIKEDFMSEQYLKTCVVGNTTEKDATSDTIVISFTEKEKDERIFYDIAVVKNFQIVEQKEFELNDFAKASEYFNEQQKIYLGKVKSDIYNEWVK